jgi:hypothetical protein
MDFDQMLEAWQAQDDKPLYGVNGDLLRLVLQNEQATIRRTLRKGKWITYLFGSGMALFAAFWLWVVILQHGPVLDTVVAAIGTGMFILWVGAFWLSRRRLAERERGFGNSLKDEIGRNLSLVDYQITNGRWRAALLWVAPVNIGALLIYWLSFRINTGSGFSVWNHAFLGFCILSSVVWTVYAADRHVKRKLEPRRDRLRDLLETLNSSE